MSVDLKDSGTRDSFSTGAVRDGASMKGRFDLTPWHAQFRLALTFEKGAAKYADRNWEKGIPMHRFVDSGLRHFEKYKAGWRDEDHLAQAAWNAMCAIETEYRAVRGILPSTLLDLPEPHPLYGANTPELIASYKAMLLET